MKNLYQKYYDNIRNITHYESELNKLIGYRSSAVMRIADEYTHKVLNDLCVPFYDRECGVNKTSLDTTITRILFSDDCNHPVINRINKKINKIEIKIDKLTNKNKELIKPILVDYFSNIKVSYLKAYIIDYHKADAKKIKKLLVNTYKNCVDVADKHTLYIRKNICDYEISTTSFCDNRDYISKVIIDIPFIVSNRCK